MKQTFWLFVAAASAGCSSFLSSPAPEPRQVLPRTTPVTTVRFPGGIYGHVALSNGLAVTCSGWSREDTSAVFDVSNPAKPKFLARFPAKGYSCAEPVFFGTRCYVPNGFSATVIDLSDRRAPKLAGYLNPHFPENGCSRLWTEGGKLYFSAFDGNYQVGDDGFSFVKTDKVPPKPAGRKKSAAEGEIVAELRDSALVIGKTEIPFAYNLSTVAAKDGTAYVYAPGRSAAQLLPLPTKAGGPTLFGNRYQTLALSRGNGFQTVGMQTAGCVTRVSDDLFVVDDGLVRLTRQGKWETILNRTRAVANASVDGTRIALTQCSRCRILDFTDPSNVKILDVAPKAELPLHITGCHLRGDRLFLAYTLVEEKGQDFIYKFPTKGYVASLDLRNPSEVQSMVEIPACIALDRVGDMLYVTCRNGDFAVVDASDPSDLEVKTIRRDILDGDGFKVKTFGGRTFVTSGRRIVELDTMVPAVPQVKHLYDRGDGTAAPSYDDFTIDGTRLYALAHASVDVFELDDAMRTTDAPNDCGVNGIAKTPAQEADAAVFAGHEANPKAPDGVVFRPGRFGNCFGAYVFDWAKLPDGRYAVAYGEAGLVFCDAKGGFSSEPPRGPDGLASVFAAEVLCKDGRVYVKDGDGKVWQY